MSSNSDHPLPHPFRPFTTESLHQIQEVLLKKKNEEEKRVYSEEDEETKWPNPNLSEGMTLPNPLSIEFNSKLANFPLEEIDTSLKDLATFVVITGDKMIQRYSATDSFWLLSPLNPLRRVTIAILNHRISLIFIITTILVNCWMMMIGGHSTLTEAAEIFFIAVYTLEACLKIMARGFLLHKFSYLRNPWNQLDFIIIVLAYLTIALSLENVEALRASRALRAIKIISLLPGLRVTTTAMYVSSRNLGDILFFSVVSLIVFALGGMELYKGNLTQKCIKDLPWNPAWNSSKYESQLLNHNANPKNWKWNEHMGEHRLCGESNWAGCPANFTCKAGWGNNPDYGLMSFDSFGPALLSVSRIFFIQDVWDRIYQEVLRAAGPWHVLFFFVVIFLGSLPCLNLFITIMALSFDELAKRAEEEELASEEELKTLLAEKDDAQRNAGKIRDTGPCRSRRVSKESHPNHSENPFENCEGFQESELGTELHHPVKPLNLHADDERARSLASVLYIDEGQQDIPKSDENLQETLSMPIIEIPQPNDCLDLEKASTPAANASQHKLSCGVRNGKVGECVCTFCNWNCGPPWKQFQECVSGIIFHPLSVLFITTTVLVNTIFLTVDYHGMARNRMLMRALIVGNYVFTGVYAVEAAMKLIAMGPKSYFQRGWNIFDFFIVAVGLLETCFEDSNLPGIIALRMTRLFRMFKLAEVWPTLGILFVIFGKTIGALWNLLLILVVTIFCFSVMGTNLFSRKYFENVHLFKNGEMPRMNFTDFWHSFMVVFRVLCGQWIESLLDCHAVSGWICVPYFLAAVVLGYLIILRLLLALLLSSFGPSNLLYLPTGGKNKELREAFRWIGKIWKWLGGLVRSKRNRGEKDIGSPPVNADQKHPADSVEDEESEELVDNHDPLEEDLEEYPQECCPAQLWKLLPISGVGAETSFGKRWERLRLRTFRCAEHKYFERTLLVVIIISSILLTLEDVHLPERTSLQMTLHVTEWLITSVFVLEMLVKWVGLGLKAYFTNPWHCFDFAVAIISFLSCITTSLGFDGIPVFGTFKTLRALRPLRIIHQIQGLKVLGTGLIVALPPTVKILFPCLFVWLGFAMLGVQLFSGEFYKCVEPNKVYFNNLIDYRLISGKHACMAANLTWVNSPMNFDHVGMAYLSLLQVSTFRGWMSIMKDATDARGEDLQPFREINFVIYAYFVAFIIFGTFFIFNVFTGVVTDCFREARRKVGGSLEMFMTSDQKRLYYVLKKIGSFKPRKVIMAPKWKPQAFAFQMVTHKKFELFPMFFIALNMLAMSLDHYQPDPTLKIILYVLNILFVVVFCLESALKIFALRCHYFTVGWNVYDFGVALLSIFSVAFPDLTKTYLVSPNLLRLVRVVRVGRILRLGNGYKGVRAILHTMKIFLPQLFYLFLVLFLIISVYAIFGMFLFMNIQLDARSGLDDLFNFRTFWQSMLLLFQMSTTAGWDRVLDGLTLQPEKCGDEGDKECVHPGLGIAYILSYLGISYFVILNTCISALLESYFGVTEDMQEGLVDEDYEMFHEKFAEFDPEGTQHVGYDQLSGFVDSLEPPLQMSKPNKYQLIMLDIPICKDDRIHRGDILLALAMNFFTKRGYSCEDDLRETGCPGCGGGSVSSTLWRQREHYSARIIQSAWRKHKNQKTQRSIQSTSANMLSQ